MFYAALVRASVVLNDYYVDVPAGAMSVGFSWRRFTEYREDQKYRPGRPLHRAEIILDFQGLERPNCQNGIRTTNCWGSPPAGAAPNQDLGSRHSWLPILSLRCLAQVLS